MIVPIIALKGGKAVPTAGNNPDNFEPHDPLTLAERYAVAGEITLLDLDGDTGDGQNERAILSILHRYPCRVGGGIRNLETAKKWLDAGARTILVEPDMSTDLLAGLPKNRVAAALPAGNTEPLLSLAPYVSGFVINFSAPPSNTNGIDLDRVEQILEATDNKSIMVYGGIRSPGEIAKIDMLGADAGVCTALLSDELDLADGIVAPLKTDRPDGFYATVIVDEQGQALGLAWSDMESIRDAVNHRRGAYHSRSRGLWVKGLTSGNTQKLINVSLDCDRDAMRYVVTQGGKGFCHNDTWTCWGEDWGLGRLHRRLQKRLENAPPDSYTKTLFDDPDLLKSKLQEEAAELAEADGVEQVTHEAADLLYFALTAMARAGVSLPDVERELLKRSLVTTRRTGAATRDEG
jgi:phosphoribosyl-ATP pyrophosphohydrolase